MIRALAALVLFAALPSHALTSHSGPYEVQVIAAGVPARTFQSRGDTFVLGHLGERYTLRVLNHSGRRIEAVVSVDGRDVIDGKPADFRNKRGYLVPAWGSVEIDGWRISQDEAAAFRFSRVADSYAAKTGTARDVGVIGVAIFSERYVPPPPPVIGYGEPRSRDDLGATNQALRAENEAAPPAPERAPAAAPQMEKRAAQRPGLGTEYGEAVSSHIQHVAFERARQQPDVLLGARYDDRDGLLALGIDVDGLRDSEAQLRRTAEPFPVVERGYAEPPPGWHR